MHVPYWLLDCQCHCSSAAAIWLLQSSPVCILLTRPVPVCAVFAAGLQEGRQLPAGMRAEQQRRWQQRCCCAVGRPMLSKTAPCVSRTWCRERGWQQQLRQRQQQQRCCAAPVIPCKQLHGGSSTCCSGLFYSAHCYESAMLLVEQHADTDC